jgi:hypothetical protein
MKRSGRLSRILKRNYYIESLVSGGVVEYIVWYGRFTTIPFFGLRYTLLYGLDFEIFDDIKMANEFLRIQKRMYKISLASKYRR